jgi:succinate dehydrogenase / fumarate reductase membrane anchor subunit
MLTRILTRAYTGPRTWLLQRLTAVLLASYLLMLMALLMMHKPMLFAAWKTLFDPLWMRVATLLFLFSLFTHAWLGVRDMLHDYLPSARIRRVSEWLITMLLLLYSIWSVHILWR